MTPAGRGLRRRQGHAHPGGAAIADRGQKRPPSTAQVQHATARLDADLLGYVVVLAALGLLEAQ